MKNNQGTVLIIVLIILTGLAAIASRLSQFVLYDHALANLNKRTTQSKIFAESGENLAVKLLRNNLSATSAARKHTLEELTIIWQAIMDSFKSEDFSIQIVDENSFFPINNIFSSTDDTRKRALYHQQILKNILVNLMKQNGYAGTEENAYEMADEMLNSMLIWGGQIAPDAEELKKYLALPVRCFPPERPFENPQELNLIAWPQTIDQTLIHNIINGTDNGKGLIDIVSVWSSGPMNIVFLEPVVVRSLYDGQNQAGDFLQQILLKRTSKENLNETAWYREIFESFAQNVPSQSIVSHSSRVFRFHIRVGAGNNNISMVSICTIYDNYIKWKYKNIQ